MSRKIAPTLRWIIDTADYANVKDNWVKGDKEYRALRAVARAARRWHQPPQTITEWNKRCHALHVAVARLDKLSKGTP